MQSEQPKAAVRLVVPYDLTVTLITIAVLGKGRVQRPRSMQPTSNSSGLAPCSQAGCLGAHRSLHLVDVALESVRCGVRRAIPMKVEGFCAPRESKMEYTQAPREATERLAPTVHNANHAIQRVYAELAGKVVWL